ncbi:MAG: hypothetical protein ACREBR_02760, partial [bacterium]
MWSVIGSAFLDTTTEWKGPMEMSCVSCREFATFFYFRGRNEGHPWNLCTSSQRHCHHQVGGVFGILVTAAFYETDGLVQQYYVAFSMKHGPSVHRFSYYTHRYLLSCIFCWSDQCCLFPVIPLL